MNKTYTPYAGEWIGTCIENSLELSGDKNCWVDFEFNGNCFSVHYSYPVDHWMNVVKEEQERKQDQEQQETEEDDEGEKEKEEQEEGEENEREKEECNECHQETSGSIGLQISKLSIFSFLCNFVHLISDFDNFAVDITYLYKLVKLKSMRFT